VEIVSGFENNWWQQNKEEGRRRKVFGLLQFRERQQLDGKAYSAAKEDNSWKNKIIVKEWNQDKVQ
jgi:hypothetical protein